MIRVAFCDDELQEIDIYSKAIRKKLDKANIRYEMECFRSGKELLDSVESNRYDIIVLDIEMPEVNGIEVGSYIMNKDDDIKILFLSGKEEFVFESFCCRPFRFIRKAKFDYEIEEALQSAISSINDEILMFESKTLDIKVKLKDIMYLEAKGHYLHLFISDNTVKIIRNSLKEFVLNYNSIGFVQIHAGFAVNLRYVARVTSRVVELDNGMELPIGRKRIMEVRSCYSDYMRRWI